MGGDLSVAGLLVLAVAALRPRRRQQDPGTKVPISGHHGETSDLLLGSPR